MDPEAAELRGAQECRCRRVGVELPTSFVGVMDMDGAVHVAPATDDDLPDVSVHPDVLIASHPVAVAGDATLELHPEVLLGAPAQDPGVARDRVDARRAPVAEPRVHQPLRESPPSLCACCRVDGHVGRAEPRPIIPADRVGITHLPETHLPTAPAHPQTPELVTRQKVLPR